jgi:tripartite-type tricarboxylate transporter receptor subunit TctC
MQRRHFLQSTAATTAAALMLPGLAQAQPGSASATWPARPLRIIVPFTPGGTTDLVARLVGTELGNPRNLHTSYTFTGR